MGKSTRSRRWLVGAMSIVVLLLGPNCQAIKKRRMKPPEGVETNSYAVRLRGYEQTITVKAPPADVLTYISDSKNLALPELKLEETNRPQSTEVGDYSPFVVRALGLVIKGNLIIMKKDKEQLWLVLDTPLGFHVERWEFKPVKEGTRLSFRMEYEVPDKGILAQMGKLAELVRVSDELEQRLDHMLALVQAHFDPTLDPEELVAEGLRGEGYETMVQVNEAQVWASASPERVEGWLTVAENMDQLFSNLITFEKPISQEFASAAPGEVVSSPGVIKAGKIHSKIDLCLVRQKPGSELLGRMFGVTLGYVGVLELYVMPQAGGSLLKTRFLSEIPAAIASETMELFSFVLGVPQLLPERVLVIKQGVENQGQTQANPVEGSR